MDQELSEILGKVALTIRGLAMDAVQKANSGHPGLPMGCAEIGAYLWGKHLIIDPADSNWPNRDRFVLSAGHGCMLQYACLHLAGYKLSLDEIKNFRQLHSQTPGHPEFGDTDGLEVTTGPLGQGVGNSVGLALAYKLLAGQFNKPEQKIFNNKIYCLAGDGCMMEGVSHEAASLAGHLGLDNLILLYDANQISLDGPLAQSMSEDVMGRYRAYGWEVHEVDGHNLEELDEMLTRVRETQERPALVVCHTIIGKGSPNKAGSNKAHGSPLGEEEVALAKRELGLPEEEFYIPQAVINFFEQKRKRDAEWHARWQERFEAWSRANPELRETYDAMAEKRLPEDLEEQLRAIEMKSPLAGRAASGKVIQRLSELLPQLIGGSADLSGSDKTMIEESDLISPHSFGARNIKYGVREFGMGTIANGLARSDMFTPFVGTFLTFSDYMRNAIRLAALMKVQVIYQFTHDSIFLGEDGPTHQAVEHPAALRAIPGLQFLRPGDSNEVKMAWIAALRHHGPSVIALTRQGLPEEEGTDVPFAEGVGRGAYIVKKEKGEADFTLIGTGSELHLAMDAAAELEKLGKSVRVVSMPCWELFEQQDAAYRDSLFGSGKRVSIEAGVEQGWHKYIGSDGIAISLDRFGLSAPASALAQEFGFTVDAILERILP
jgi:transketolase